MQQQWTDLFETEVELPNEPADGVGFNPFDFQTTFSIADSEIFTKLDFSELDGVSEDDREADEVNEEDFLEDNRWIVIRLKHHVKQLVNKNSSHETRQKAAYWFFVKDTPDAKGVTLNSACETLYCRPDVVQTRAIYEMWLRDVSLVKPISMFSTPLPYSLYQEVGQKYPAPSGNYSAEKKKMGRNSLVGDFAERLWSWPGMPYFEAIKICADLGLKPSLIDEMMYDGRIGICGKGTDQRVYFISRNPTIMPIRARRTFSWAESILN